MAASFALDKISLMLQNITNDTIYTYGICEDQPPHKMIAISTGRQITDQKCIINNQTGVEECTISHLTIDEIGNNNETEDVMLRKGHDSLFNGNNPGMTVTLTEELGEVHLIYIASARMYEPAQNIMWRVITIWPLATSSSTNAQGETGFIVILICSILGCVLCLILFLAVYKRRRERAVQLADFQLTSAFLIICAMLNLSLLSYLGERTNVLCNLSFWVPRVLLFTTLSVIIVKVYRLYYVLIRCQSNSAKRSRLNNRQVISLFLWLFFFL